MADSQDDVGRREPRGSGSVRDAGALLSLVRVFALIVTGFAVVFWVPGLSENPAIATAMCLTALAVMVVVHVLAKKGHPWAGGVVFVSLFLVIALVGIVVYGFQGPDLGFLPVVVLFAGLLCGWRTAVAFAALSLVSAATLLGLVSTGVVVSPLAQATPSSNFTVSVGLVVLVAVYLSRSLRLLGDAIDSAEASARAALQSERRLADLVRESPDGFLFLTETGVVEDCNLKVQELTGLGRDDLLGGALPALPWLADASRARLGQALERVLRDEVAELVELELVDLQGDPRQVEAHVQVVRHEAGRRSVQVVARDITERIRARAEREALERELREVHHLESLGRLAGGIAHDFNNVLQVVLGNAEVIGAAGDLPPWVAESARQIVDAGERAGGLTHQLLAFARRQVLEPRVLDLDEVLREVEPLLRRLLPENIELRVSSAADLARVRADPSQLVQVIINLAVNARDAMPEGGRLTIETSNVEVDESYASRHPEVGPGPYVALIVSDTGVGMGSETLERIFEPFFTTKADRGGTGLGLPTVHGVIKQHGGHIVVYSEPGHGACFKVFLPMNDLAEGAHLHSPSGGSVTARGETVLVVDDDEGVRQTIGLVLETVGYKVLLAADGADGLEKAAEHDGPIALLITDVVMPKMGGRALAEELCRRRPGLRVLFMSGYAENAIVHGGELDKGLNFLAKPAAPAALMLKIRSILDPAGG